MTSDALFRHVEDLHRGRPLATVLDAGTGAHSLRWLTTLGARVTGVTADEPTAARLRTEFPDVELVTGDWQDAGLLSGRRYDVVVADYLLGAVDGFAPYYQEHVFARLHPHVGDRLYAIGLEPWPARDDDPDAQAFIDLCRTRDAAFLLAGTRPYREFPEDWVAHTLERSGFHVVDRMRLPIRHSARTIDREHGNVVRYAQRADRDLGAALIRRADGLRDRLLARVRREPLLFGHDWVVSAGTVAS